MHKKYYFYIGIVVGIICECACIVMIKNAKINLIAELFLFFCLIVLVDTAYYIIQKIDNHFNNKI